MKILQEFKAFAVKGNVIDLAVAVVIGAAFGKIVTSLVDDIIMPLIGMATGGIDFTNLIWKVGEAEVKYGVFIQAIVNFLIIALCIFIIIHKIMKTVVKKKEEPKKEEPKKPSQEELLTEIRDLLKKKA